MSRCAGDGTFDKESIAANIDQLRKAFRLERRMQGLSQEALARRIGVSRTMLAHYELGTGSPSMGSLFAWADTLGFGITIYRKR